MPKEVINGLHSGDADDMPSPFVQLGWSRGAGLVVVSTLAGGDYDERVTARPGISAALDRDGINRLIRALRKARDQSFGADA